jgi:predicted negative regulator of RcsB-dependent stress response
MAKQRSTADVFDEFESSAERLADWIRRHAIALSVTLVVVIGAVWGVQAWRQHLEDQESAAAAALAEVRGEYLIAMGGQPGSLEPPELANPEAARKIRSEFAERFRQVAADHTGCVSATLATLQALELEADVAGPEATLAGLETALAAAPDSPTLRASVLQRLAQVLEAQGRFAEAAARYESAGAIVAFPLHAFSLAEAARCYADAGEPQKALALYDRIQAESPGFVFPDNHRMLRRELMAAAGT